MSRRRARRPVPTTDKRSPEARLEALVREPNRERALRMMGRIREDLDAVPEPGPWIDAARTLSERLIISDDALYYFVEVFTECLVSVAMSSDADLARIVAEMNAIEHAHGLKEGQYWRTNEGPPEWRSLDKAWERRANEIVGSRIRELGHADIADLFTNNSAEFERRSAKGHADLWGDDEGEDYDDPPAFRDVVPPSFY